MKKLFFFAMALYCQQVWAQDAIEYQTPPKEIYELAMAKPTPSVLFDSKGEWMLIQERSSMPTVEELAQPELRIAGLRINPNNFAPSRNNYFINIIVKNVKTGAEFPVAGLPANLKAGNVQWSPDEDKVAFTNTTNTGVDIYQFDIRNKKAAKINKQPVNLVLGNPFEWLDNKTIVYKAITKPAAAAPKKPLAPKGPVVQQNLGKVAASVTYQDLIKSPFDELLFEFYATTQLTKNSNGIETKLGKPAIYKSISFSPDNNFLLVERTDKPFSYLVTYSGFNSTVYIADKNGKEIKQLAKIPSGELAPTGYDNELNAPRDFEWIETEAAKLVWIEPMDSGLIKKKLIITMRLIRFQLPSVAPLPCLPKR